MFHSIILGSNYTGEINARISVAESINSKITVISINEAKDILNTRACPEKLFKADVIIGGTGEETTELVLNLAENLKIKIKVFLASILPAEIHPLIRAYDLILCPPHKELNGSNIITILGVPHRYMPNKDKRENHKNGNKILTLGLLLGGNTKYCKAFDDSFALSLARKLKFSARLNNANYLITNSRRTPDSSLKIIRTNLVDFENKFIGYDNSNTYSYYNILNKSDILIVTGDSVSMCCEAASSGKPVYVIKDSRIMESYHIDIINNLLSKGYLREYIYTDKLSLKRTRLLYPAKEIANKILQLLGENSTKNG